MQEKAVASLKTKPAPKGNNAAQAKGGKKVLRGKDVAAKKKREHLRFGIDCTNIAEDNIMDVADFVSVAIASRLSAMTRAPSGIIRDRPLMSPFFSSVLISVAGKVSEGTLQGER